jgi:hypothetical protein
MMRQLGIAVSLLLGATACDSGPHVKAQAYKTDGSGQIQTCWGAGIQFCGFESASLPEFINAHDPEWGYIRSDRKPEGFTMCYLDLPGGIFSERLLMFRCEPLDIRVPTSASLDPQRVKVKVLENLQALAESAAGFEVCASDKRAFHRSDRRSKRNFFSL